MFSQNDSGQRKPLRASSPTFNLELTSPPLNRATVFYIYMFLEDFFEQLRMVAEQLHHLKVCSQPRREKIPTFYLRNQSVMESEMSSWVSCMLLISSSGVLQLCKPGVLRSQDRPCISLYFNQDSSILTRLPACLLWHLEKVFVLQKGK